MTPIPFFRTISAARRVWISAARRLWIPAATLLVVVLLLPGVLEAQQPAARQMRHFWHVFAAYAIAWVLVFGWAVSIARRLRRLEERLER